MKLYLLKFNFKFYNYLLINMAIFKCFLGLNMLLLIWSGVPVLQFKHEFAKNSFFFCRILNKYAGFRSQSYICKQTVQYMELYDDLYSEKPRCVIQSARGIELRPIKRHLGDRNLYFLISR